MNRINKIKKFFGSIVVTIGTFITKTFAASPTLPPNDVTAVTLYGVPRPPVLFYFSIICKFLMIPIIVIVGIIVYLKKKRNKD